MNTMITKFDFELVLEKIAEKFYSTAASGLTLKRGGNTSGNEAYFKNVAHELREGLNCQQLILPKGSCPDSGVFGKYNYKHQDDINWNLVRDRKIIVLQVIAPQNQKRYLEIDSKKIIFPELISDKKDKILNLNLNQLDEFGDLFGVEYKASVNASRNSLGVASFNSSCPSNTKTTEVPNVEMIHNFPTKMRRKFNNDSMLKICDVKLTVNFLMYYFIVNDIEIGNRSEIKKILLCRGSFFAPTTTQETAEFLSKQLSPNEIGRKIELYRVNLRYRPFFESRVIQTNGFGIYTSWEPRMISKLTESMQQKALLEEVEKIQQQIQFDEDGNPLNQAVLDEDNVIYLNLTEARILRRAA